MMDKEDGGCHLLAKSLFSFWPGELKKYNLYNITSLYVIQVSDSQGIFIYYNMLFSISTLVSSIDLGRDSSVV
jgi:hypothetical protein